MNVDDIGEDVIPTNFSKHDRLVRIFARQRVLMEKYHHIEVKNNLCHTPDCPVNLHDRFGQARLKDFMWRVTEELTEAAEANRIHPELRSHVLEELADALHFLVELHMLAGITPHDIWPIGVEGECRLEFIAEKCRSYDSLEAGCFDVIYWLGCASNCLKQRPWKQTHQLTDTKKFHGYLVKTLPILVSIFVDQGLNADEIFRMYYKKSEVNKFRQRSNY